MDRFLRVADAPLRGLRRPLSARAAKPGRYDHRAYQHHGHRTALGVEQADHPLVAGEQLGNVFRGGLVHREQPAGNVDHLAQGAGQRHVHAVVVPGGQVDGGEVAAHEGRGQFGVAAEQFGQAVAVAFGLEDPPVLDRAELADRAIGRAEHRAGLLGQRAGAILQGAGEEGIEMFIGLQVLDLRFAHIDLVAPGEPGDQAVLEPGRPAVGGEADQPGQQVVRQQVLAADEQTIFERHSSNLYRGIGVVAPFRPGAGVAFDPRVAQRLGHQVGEAGAMVGLAVGDHFLVRRDAEVLQDFGDIRADAQGASRVHAGGPFEIDRAGHMPGLRGEHLGTGVFAGAARIERAYYDAIWEEMQSVK